MLNYEFPTAARLPDPGQAGLGSAAPLELTPPQQSADPEALFTLRWCHVLAHAIHDRTGWPVVVVGDVHSGWVHAGVKMPTGQILDVAGRHSPHDWLDGWAPVMDEYGRDYVDQCDGTYSPEDVAIYGWDEVNADETIGPTEVPPAHVLAVAAQTSASLLAQMGWIDPRGPASSAGPA